MFFFLSKTLNYFAQPLVLVAILFLVGLVVRSARKKKIIFSTTFLLLILFSNEFIAIEAMRLWEEPITPLTDIRKEYDYGILLTGITKSQSGPRDRVYFGRGADRVTHSMQLYKLGIIKKIIISGGSGRLVDVGAKEADDLAGFLILTGVPQDDIIVEDQSDNTYQSAVAVAKILADREGPASCLLITSAFHLPRSKACFSKAGVDTDIFATDPMTHKRVYSFDTLFVPKIDSMAIWQTLFKEWVGMTAYWIAGYI